MLSESFRESIPLTWFSSCKRHPELPAEFVTTRRSRPT
jgi:hypothetical protein